MLCYVSMIPPEIVADHGIPVKLPSGSQFSVATQSEKTYVEDRVTRYLSDNKFVNISDLQELDRLISFELFTHRWNLFLSRGVDYWNEEVDPKSLAEQIQKVSSELRQLKKNLGIDKVARDRARGDDSWATYHDNLLQRAKAFGYMRNEQYIKAITLWQELAALMTLHDRSDEQERRENHATTEDLMTWIRDLAIPEFDAIDQKFVNEEQSLWIRAQ